MGLALAPIFGIHLSSLIGFRLCTDTVALSCLTLGVLYFIMTKELN